MKKVTSSRKQLNTIKKEIAQKKITVVALSLVIFISWVTIGVTAWVSVNRPARASTLLVSDPTISSNQPIAISDLAGGAIGNDMGLLNPPGTSTPTSTPFSCCGTANGKTYSCDATGWGSDTFCKFGRPALSVLSRIPKEPQFPSSPTSGQTVVNWACNCGETVFSYCSAAKREDPMCSPAAKERTVFLGEETYRQMFFYKDGGYMGLTKLSANPILSSLCSGGKVDVLNYGSPWSNGSDSEQRCMDIEYVCLCSGKHSGRCLARYCKDQNKYNNKGNVLRGCGDVILDEDLGEECEQVGSIWFRYIYDGVGDGLFGHSCADKGLCGTVKCTDKCKLDYSNCSPCPPPPPNILTPGSQ